MQQGRNRWEKKKKGPPGAFLGGGLSLALAMALAFALSFAALAPFPAFLLVPGTLAEALAGRGFHLSERRNGSYGSNATSLEWGQGQGLPFDVYEGKFTIAVLLERSSFVLQYAWDKPSS